MEKVAMIIPMYNKVKCVEKTLQSVVDNIHYDNFECIIVDDESTDGSSDIAIQFAKAYPNRFRYVRVLNGGVSRARNFGVQCTDAEYVCFLDADDEVYSDYVTKGVKAFDIYNIDLYLENTKIKDEEYGGMLDLIKADVCKTYGGVIMCKGVDYLLNDCPRTSFCSGLYRRDMVLRYGFLENTLIEDYVFMHNYIFHSKNVFLNLKEYGILYNVFYSERNKEHNLKNDDWLIYTHKVLNKINNDEYPWYVDYFVNEEGIDCWQFKLRDCYQTTKVETE